MHKNLVYDLEDKVPFKHILIYGFQELLAILIATVLISSILGVSTGAGFIGAGLGTLIYIFITKGKSNVYLSNAGCYVGCFLYAFAAGGGTAAFIGALTICVVYSIFGIVLQKFPIEAMYKVLPKPLIASITMLIGLSLIGYVPTYLGNTGIWGTIVALITAFTIGLTMHYANGRFKTLPFLVGVGVGYIISVILTITGVAPLVDFSIFEDIKLIQVPIFNWTLMEKIPISTILSVVLIYAAYSLSGVCEVIADHQAMSTVISRDLLKENGLRRIFIATGLANATSGLVSGIALTSYGEGTGVTAASRVANARVTGMTSVFLILMGFCGPIQALLVSIPSIVMAGASLILYPLIMLAGTRVLIENQINLDESKNLLLVAVPIAIGLGGIAIGGTTFSFSGVGLALVVGCFMNLILKDKGDINA